MVSHSYPHHGSWLRMRVGLWKLSQAGREIDRIADRPQGSAQPKLISLYHTGFSRRFPLEKNNTWEQVIYKYTTLWYGTQWISNVQCSCWWWVRFYIEDEIKSFTAPEGSSQLLADERTVKASVRNDRLDINGWWARLNLELQCGGEKRRNS